MVQWERSGEWGPDCCVVFHIHDHLHLHHERHLILCKLNAWQKRAVIKISLVCDSCLCNLSEPRSGIPGLLPELKPHLLQAKHQSAPRRLALCWISAGWPPPGVCDLCRRLTSRPWCQVLRCLPWASTWVEAHHYTRYRPESKKPNQLWSHPAAPGSKWGLIPRKP